VPSDLEEVVVDADLVDLEQVLPDRREAALEMARRALPSGP